MYENNAAKCAQGAIGTLCFPRGKDTRRTMQQKRNAEELSRERSFVPSPPAYSSSPPCPYSSGLQIPLSQLRRGQAGTLLRTLRKGVPSRSRHSPLGASKRSRRTRRSSLRENERGEGESETERHILREVLAVTLPQRYAPF